MDQIPTKALAVDYNYRTLLIVLATDGQATRHLPTRGYSFCSWALVLKAPVLAYSTSYFSTTFSLGIFWLIKKYTTGITTSENKVEAIIPKIKLQAKPEKIGSRTIIIELARRGL